MKMLLIQLMIGSGRNKMNNSILKHKPFIIAVIVLVLLVLTVAYFSFTQVTRSGKNAILIDIFPTNARITIDNQKVSRGTVYLEPGTYSIKASQEGFKEYSDILVVDSSMKTYVMTLVPDSEEAEKIYEDQKDEYARVRKLSEQAVRESGEYFHKRNPIVSKLPYRSFIYTIGYRMDQSDPSGNSIIIEIDAHEGYRQAALYKIRELGYDPTDLTINFRDYENPFTL